MACFLIWFMCCDRRVGQPVYDIGDQSFTVAATPVAPTDPRLEVIHKINEQNAKISSLQGDLGIETKKRFVNLTGKVAFKKDRYFRFQVNSRLGKEMDLGSNESDFWFASSQYENGTLFYCSHDKVGEARLKTPFHPVWMMDSLGFNRIDTTGVTLMDKDSYLAVIRDTEDARKQPCRVVTMIDPKKARVCGYYLYNQAGSLLASSEVMKYDSTGVYPRKWSMRWNEEGLSMELELLNPSVNHSVDPAQWRMPAAKRSVDMSKD